MPFGRKKNGTPEEPVEEPSRLYSSSKKQQRPTFTNANPYATQDPDPYAADQDPYAPRSSNPPPYQGSLSSEFERYRQEKSPVPPGGYGGAPPSNPTGVGLPSNPRAGGRGGLPSGPKDRTPSAISSGSGSRDRTPSAVSGSSGPRDRNPSATSGSSGSRDRTPSAMNSGFANSGSNNNYSGYGGGEDRYGGPSPAPSASRYGMQGYGGLGVAPPMAQSQDAVASRNALFGDAPSRYGGANSSNSSSNPYATNSAPQPNPSRSGGGNGPTSSSSNPYANNPYSANDSQANKTALSEWESGQGPDYGSDANQSYGNYEERNLTAEEIEEEEVMAAKTEIRAIKQQDVSSTRNALRIAAQAEETGRATLERLGAQGERIHNTERNLDLASNQNRLAAEKARELKTLNRSMFAVHVANPFTSKQRAMEREQQVLDQARRDREERDATRAEAWSSTARAQKQAMGLNKSGGAKKGSSLAERSKYQFEADSEDEQMEDEIDQNLDLLHGAAGRLKNLSLAMGDEVEAQNKHIERIGGKVDKVDDEIALNRSRLDRIR